MQWIDRLFRGNYLKSTFINIMLVGTGGFVGALLRYGLSGLIQRTTIMSTFPYGTLVVNMLGCLLIGFAAGFIDSRQISGEEVRLFALVGLLGGFTTYSAFGYETLLLLRDTDYLRAIGNVAIHVVLGISLVWAGYELTSR
ncbi:MAG: fluoride efflux transporter CrcB [Woeseia sp.]|nr:fluoride efflux transporter CrcB [Woeseia sp.]